MTDEELYNLSDDELEAAFKAAKAELQSPETDLEIPEPVEQEVEVEDDFEEYEEEQEDLEQPEEDSDDDASSEDEDEEESEDESESEEDDHDGDTETEDEETDEDKDESKDEEQPIQKRKYRANGQEFEFSDDEIFEKFGQVFGQAMNYTQKMQQIKPWRKTIDAIEQAQLSESDINFAIDVLKGDKDAIATLLKRTGTDALELDVENTSYTPKDYGRNDTELDIKDIVAEISNDREYATTYDVLERQWDAQSREIFAKNPEMIRQLHIDVKSGMFDTIAPLANKMKVYEGGKHSDLEYYQLAAQQYFNTRAQEEARQEALASERLEKEQAERDRVARVKADSEKRKANKSASSKRKAATPPKKSASPSKVVDYLDDSDEGFEEWYKNKVENYL